MTREDVTNSKEYQRAKLAMEWFATHDNDDVDALDGYEAGYQQAIEHPTGGELLHVLNKGHEQGYKDAFNKACKFLEKRMWEMNSPTDDTTYVVDGVSSSISEFIKNFKDYMRSNNNDTGK